MRGKEKQNMAIQSVTLKFSAKKTNGSNVNWTTSGGGSASELIGTGTTESAAKAQVQAQIDTSIAAAQGNLQDQQDASGAFNS